MNARDADGGRSTDGRCSAEGGEFEGSPDEAEEPVQRSRPYSGRKIAARRRRVLAALVVGLAVLGASRWEPVPADEPDERAPRTPAAAELAPTLAMPGEVNDRVDRWIEHYLERDRRSFEEFLSRENIYGGMIRQKLRERGMPEDLLYLAMIESGFSTAAISRVEASGLWQFMGPTAQEYGLEISEYVDERRDPLRATDAALDYLERMHERFGSWYLAAAAYNAGPARVARAVRSSGSDAKADEELFWEIVDRLPSETRNYVPKLLAAVLLAKEAEKHGFQVNRSEPYRFERVWVPGGTSLDRIAEVLDLPVREMWDLNPHLVQGTTPPGTSYAVRVPPGRAPQVVASLGREWSLAAD